SRLFSARNRINILLYGQEARFYSIGISDATNYYVQFDPDFKVDIPGGYGKYRIGSIGKLADLENKPDIYRRTFSALIGTFLNYYFYPSRSDIYYGGKTGNEFLPLSLKDIFLSASNANLFERFYLFLFATRLGTGKYKNLPFSPDSFRGEYQGYFYHEVYRKEKLSVQILYSNSYKTAGKISEIIEGQGIRVGDISQEKQTDFCKVSEQTTKRFSQTAQALANYFNCSLEQNSTGAYDILFTLGHLEKDWEIGSK
ncbi:hypothetical protein HY214_03560, partial [Candidatus Roizmanbacteria bacterium]|nr:hypothetical protein [Candidatus Roizmanbacteria bacterium]